MHGFVLSRPALSNSAIPWTVTCQAPLSMGILQARILEWVAMPSTRGSSQPRNQTQASRVAGEYCLIPQGSWRILEWVACPFSRGYSQARDQIGVCCVAGRFFISWATREAFHKVYIYQIITLYTYVLLLSFQMPLKMSEGKYKYKIWVLIIKFDLKIV